LENNLTRIEDTKYLLPQIEQKIEFLRKTQREKIEILRCASQLLNDQFVKLLNLFTRNEMASFGDPFSSTTQSFFTSVIGDERNTTISGLIQATKNEEIRTILEKMNVGKILKAIIENIVKFVYSTVFENFNTKVGKKVR